LWAFILLVRRPTTITATIVIVQIEAFFALIREISLAKVKSCPKLALVFRVK